MRAFLLGVLFFSTFVFYTHKYALCKIWHKCDDELSLNTSLENIPTLKNTTALLYGDSLLLGGFERFKTNHTSREFRPTTNNLSFIEKTIAFLEKHPDTKLCIIGTAFMNEPVTSFYESEGLRRAALIRNQFLAAAKSHQIDENRFDIDDIISINDVEPQISFRLLPKPEKVMAYRFKKMTFYSDNFIEGDATLQPKSAFINYSDSLRTLITARPHINLAIHCYISDKSQQKIAFQRSQVLHTYFMALGLLSNNIKLNIIIDDAPLAVVNNLQSILRSQRFEVEIN